MKPVNRSVIRRTPVRRQLCRINEKFNIKGQKIKKQFKKEKKNQLPKLILCINPAPIRIPRKELAPIQCFCQAKS